MATPMRQMTVSCGNEELPTQRLFEVIASSVSEIVDSAERFLIFHSRYDIVNLILQYD